ncbi:DUF397 domain-containing protein [Streptomyces sp. B93]|nr:DUF397 domain-containing protein [Streptomyces sp. B93]
MPISLVATALVPEDAWFKSSYSDAMRNCLEAAPLPHPTAPSVAIRDSKSPVGPALLLLSSAWAAFVAYLGQEGR